MPRHPLVAFLLELRRRRVTRVAIAYAVAAGGIMQGASVIFPALFLPGWCITLLVVLCLVGFPVAVALAWAFDLTSQGVRLTTAAPDAVAAAPRPRAVRRAFLGGGLVILAAIGLVLWAARTRRAAEAAPDTPVRLAVLYFEDLSPDGSLRFLAEGITSELIDHLSDVQALNVVTRSGVAPFRGTRAGLDSISRALHATLLVNGTLRRSGDSVRISVQLSDADGTVLTHNSIDRRLSDSFALVDDVVHQVATSLRSRVGEEIEVKRWRAGTSSEEAWRRLQVARSTTSDVDKMVAEGEAAAGVRMLESVDTTLAAAQRLDPHWVEPRVQRAWNAGLIAMLTRVLLQQQRAADLALQRALGHAQEAVTLAPADARALEVRGYLRDRAARTQPLSPARAAALVDSAQRDLEAAVQTDPLRARAWAALAGMRLEQRRLAEARVAAEHAYAADAYLENAWEIVATLFETSFQLEDDPSARRWCDETGRLRAAGRINAAWPLAYCSLELLAWADPPPSRADPWTIVRQALQDPAPVDSTERTRLEMLAAAVLARAGLRDSARATAARARAAAPGDPGLDYLEAAVRLQLGDRAGALERLDAFARAHVPYAHQVAAGRMFRALRGDSAYEALLERMP